jgi:hypothetical protein
MSNCLGDLAGGWRLITVSGRAAKMLEAERV